MRQPGIKYRWILSPLEFLANGQKQPVCREYALHAHSPMDLAGNIALCHCALLSSQLAAAQADPRLLVLDSQHSTQPIPETMVAQLAGYGIASGMTVHDLLVAMSAHHLDFTPEN